MGIPAGAKGRLGGRTRPVRLLIFHLRASRTALPTRRLCRRYQQSTLAAPTGRTSGFISRHFTGNAVWSFCTFDRPHRTFLRARALRPGALAEMPG